MGNEFLELLSIKEFVCVDILIHQSKDANGHGSKDHVVKHKDVISKH
jgi:hypothetical protein